VRGVPARDRPTREAGTGRFEPGRPISHGRAPIRQDDDGGHYLGEEDARDPLALKPAQYRAWNDSSLASVDLAGDDGRHEDREGGFGEEQVDLAAPDAARRAIRATMMNNPSRSAWLLPATRGRWTPYWRAC